MGKILSVVETFALMAIVVSMQLTNYKLNNIGLILIGVYFLLIVIGTIIMVKFSLKDNTVSDTLMCGARSK